MTVFYTVVLAVIGVLLLLAFLLLHRIGSISRWDLVDEEVQDHG